MYRAVIRCNFVISRVNTIPHEELEAIDFCVVVVVWMPRGLWITVDYRWLIDWKIATTRRFLLRTSLLLVWGPRPKAQKSNFDVTPLPHNFWHLGYNSENVGKQNKKLSCCCDSRSYSAHVSALCRLAALQTPLHVYWDSGGSSFFVVRFVAKRCILEQKCQKGQIGTLMLGIRWYNF